MYIALYFSTRQWCSSFGVVIMNSSAVMIVIVKVCCMRYVGMLGVVILAVPKNLKCSLLFVYSQEELTFLKLLSFVP